MSHTGSSEPSLSARALAWPRSVAAWYFSLSSYLVLVGPPAVLAALLLGRPLLVVWLGVTGVRLTRLILGLRFEVEGADAVDGDRAAVYCINHESNVDVLVFELLFRRCRRLKGLYKAELDRIPILGRVLHVANFVALRRGDREQTRRAVQRAIGMLRSGDSFVIAPEGTRSPDGELLPFKRGAFVMAIGAPVPIVPIGVTGSLGPCPGGRVSSGRGRSECGIGAPIPTAGLTDADCDALMSVVRTQIANLAAPVEAVSQSDPPLAGPWRACVRWGATVRRTAGTNPSGSAYPSEIGVSAPCGRRTGRCALADVASP